MDSNEKTDWWDLIDDEERAEIVEGLTEADRGEGIPYKEFIAKYDKWRQAKEPDRS